MSKKYDIAVIGLGPAGMAVSIMGSKMGLNVLGIEKDSLGGECMNVGCIPSKSLLRMASTRHALENASALGLAGGEKPYPDRPFHKIREYLDFIGDKKTRSMFDKVDLKLREGSASFLDRHTIQVGDRKYRAKKIFICTGTSPAVPPIPGIEDIDYLTNETLFSQEEIPGSMVIIGGGAIGCEMAQAFSRLGSRVSVVHMDPYLLPHGDPDAGELLQKVFEEEGISVYNGRKLEKSEVKDGLVNLTTDHGEILTGEKLLVAAGRKPEFSSLNLEAAGVKYGRRGIRVSKHLQTSARNIYACGDCNGHFLFSHAAMHQGMIALINSMTPAPFRKDFRRYLVPWTVFTEPQISHVGKTMLQLEAEGVDYEIIEENYADYGAAIAEGIAVGSVKAYVSKWGRIYGARIIGEGSGEMINEWGLAIQNRLRMHNIMFLQHSFPTMSFLSKRVSEGWMMNRMKSSFLKKLIRWWF
ncbi:MAG: NAD(P)/FAD-dependent oxidoreductase [Candidatus Latescibacteria bacterium]|nr:NAD(P)/FAD-dependent oxidoreductase [bacterium]MBD3423119.1 NAD(P)/FAD-dependent oxidoreductase [Candidatus Latescibacterota bacterium]